MAFTAEQLEAKVREIAARDPDYIYQPPGAGFGCVYVDSMGYGSCLIGRALLALGVPPEFFAFTGAGDKYANRLSIRDLLVFLSRGGKYISGHFPDDTVGWLGTVQGRQDERQPWGLAIRTADVAREWRARYAV